VSSESRGSQDRPAGFLLPFIKTHGQQLS
jgi:hypothetical protein